MSSVSAAGLRLALLGLGLAVASCDGAPDPGPSAVTFGGVAVAAAGGATLALEGGALVVSGIPTGADGGFSVSGALARIDVDVDPVVLPAGGRFGARIEAADGSEVASMFTEGVTGDSVHLAFSYADASAVTRVRILYKLDGEILFEIPVLRLVPALQRGSARVSSGSAGGGSGGAGSVHYIRQGGRWIAVSDSEGAGGRASGAAGGCAGYLITPPAVAGIQLPDRPLCVDWVEVQPLDGASPEAARTSVVARGVGRFTVRSLAVQ